MARSELMVAAETIRIWQKSLDKLVYMAALSSVDAEDLLSEAMRDGYSDLKHQKHIDDLRAYQERLEPDRDQRGEGVLTRVDTTKAELNSYRERVEHGKFSMVAFASWSVDRYFTRWGIRRNESQASPPMLKAP